MSSVASSVANVAKNAGSRLFLGLATQFSKPSAITRAPPSSLLPFSKAYNSLSPMYSVTTRRKQQVFQQQLLPLPQSQTQSQPQPLSHQVIGTRNISGAGVILFDKNTDSVILFENASRNCFEEPGGFLKPNYDPATSASLELFEESCTLISKTKSTFLPHFVDVSGRSDSTTYRGYFVPVDNAPSHSQYLEKRSQLQQQGYPSDYLETKGIAHIPVPHLAASLEKPINWDLDQINVPVYVKDIYGKEVPVSKRTLKIFKEGGLKILGTVSENSSATVTTSVSSSSVEHSVESSVFA